MIPYEPKFERASCSNIDSGRLPCCSKSSATGKCLLSLCATFCVCVLGSSAVYAQTSDEPAGQEVTQELPAAAQSRGLQPPSVIQSVEALYPIDASENRIASRVVLLVTVSADGTVGEVDVAVSGGQDFDASAVTAVLQWRFDPARQDGMAVDSRIKIPFEFSPPPLQTDVVAESTTVVEQPTPAPSVSDEEVIDVTVRGERNLRTEERSAGDFRIEREVIVAAPKQEGAEVLRAAPGVYIGRAEGPAVAHHYMLRGFDAEHGQDIEFRVGGLPINMPSHIHGQGYSDLSFLVADTVREMRVSEGVYDPRQGDFAVAGSIDLELGVEERERGVRVRSSYGAFNTYKQLVLWAPEKGSEDTFGAVQYMGTDGFGENRAGESGSGIFQHRFGEGELTFRTIGILHAARSNMAGVLRQEDVANGQVCFTCVYPYPTAQAQNALANRFLAGGFADYEGNDGANGQMGLWLGYDNFRIQSNFTGFLQISQLLERVGGRGDLIEQQNRTLSMGLTSRYRSSPLRPVSWAHGTVEVGADGRIDNIDQTQNLLDAAVRNQTWDRSVDTSIKALDLGFWGDLDFSFTPLLRLRTGFRGDVLSYDVDDRLGNFAPLTRPQESFIQGYRRSALGLAAGPRTSIELKPNEAWSFLAAYGEGYRSPQARILDDGEKAPFSKVRSADVGLRFDMGNPLHVTAGGFYTNLSDDVAFHAEEGRLERIGATQRLGAVFHAVTRPFDWMVGSLSFTYVDATLLEPPPPTAEEPQPPFVEGQNLPFVPPMVVRADQGFQNTLVQNVWGKALNGRLGLGYSFLSPRPLAYGGFADPVSLLDASAELSWGLMELSFEIFNALNSQYAAVEYAFPSDWSPNDGYRSRVPQRHTAAGSPLAWMLSLGVEL